MPWHRYSYDDFDEGTPSPLAFNSSSPRVAYLSNDDLLIHHPPALGLASPFAKADVQQLSDDSAADSVRFPPGFGQAAYLGRHSSVPSALSSYESGAPYGAEQLGFRRISSMYETRFFNGLGGSMPTSGSSSELSQYAWSPASRSHAHGGPTRQQDFSLLPSDFINNIGMEEQHSAVKVLPMGQPWDSPTSVGDFATIKGSSDSTASPEPSSPGEVIQ
jgi:hypothetical protein